ncbi:nuclear transport factor 2 family protein [Mucilaginibacter sp. UR6-1]|uniref:nuclear transport factor 2 family protein n=1 Tax=Mucilaginibacter sp. UR6-1 TaxID=1435643 RepID=UPI001E58A149|nr:nuclear transport factor 2 family protein [Mucilaginibacter sp. UR6-1]MCC8409972.1 nuclear transport factor 2 family protein [Mucilaginibacter sp. UR6-1]
MNQDNKTILEKANAAVTAGDNEGFLSFCTDDTVWEFIGDRTLHGKEAVRQYMSEAYVEPPQFMVEHLVAEGDYVIATGKISIKNDEGVLIHYAYCDVWRLRDGKLAELKAFVIEQQAA